MTPDDIKALRAELGCTAKELAAALGLEQAEVLAWERGDLFPTKRLVTKMQELREKGPGAIPKRRRGAPASPAKALADPELWRLVRKLSFHPELFAAARKLAEGYDDPADDAADAHRSGR
ncbi:MAG TPA: helix-turn-helix domain-containing protein [Minicystis sp.]|nr:helix-turn-helix domain-containing protein [Minicystis sp.]